MSALTFAVLALGVLMLARDADTPAGKVILTLFGGFLLTCGLTLAPWAEVFAR